MQYTNFGSILLICTIIYINFAGRNLYQLIMLEKEFKYYIDNQALLVKKYNGRFIVIKGEKIIGDYSSTEEAYKETIKTHELGTFLIQECLPGKESYTQTFHSRVVFS